MADCLTPVRLIQKQMLAENQYQNRSRSQCPEQTIQRVMACSPSQEQMAEEQEQAESPSSNLEQSIQERERIENQSRGQCTQRLVQTGSLNPEHSTLEQERTERSTLEHSTLEREKPKRKKSPAPCKSRPSG